MLSFGFPWCSLLFFAVLGPFLFAADHCEEPFLKLSDAQVIKSLYAPAKRPSELKKPLPPVRLSRTNRERLQKLFDEKVAGASLKDPMTTRDLVALAERTLDPEEARAFSDWLHAQFFEDPLVNFEDQFLGRQRQLFPGGPTRYNQNGERPFEGYISARQYLQSLPISKMELSHILEAHRKLMSRESIRGDKGKVFQTDRVPAKNSGGLKDSELGTIRSESVGFQVEGGTVPSALDGIGHRATEIEKENPYVKQVRDGSLSYAPLFRWRSIDAKKPFSDALAKKLVALEKKYGSVGLRQGNTPELAEAQKEMLTELTERLWQETLGDLEAAKTQEEVIRTAARFQKEFVSVHPFLDGNGRLARLLTEKLLEAKGLPAPLYTHWGEDVALPQEQLETLMAHGILLSRDYHSALAKALGEGQSFVSVPQPAVAVRAQELLGGPQEPWDSQAFLAWAEKNRESLRSFPEAVQRYFASDPALSRRSPHSLQIWKQEQEHLPKNPEDQAAAFEAWQSTLRGKNTHREVRLAPGAFQRSFARLSASEAEYQEKMDAFYADRSIFRGVPVDRYFTDEEVVRMLAEPTPLTNGNGVPLHQDPNSHFPVFQNFNQELLRGGDFLSFQTRAHTEGSSADYFTSGMVSFTDEVGIGRNWQFSTLKSVGVLFKARERTVGVIHTGKPTERFGKLGLEHEREHALVGGVDPESIVEIEVKQQTQDPKNRVQRKTKKAKRINFNTVEVTELIYEGEGLPRMLPSTLWRIESDGSVRELSPSR